MQAGDDADETPAEGADREDSTPESRRDREELFRVERWSDAEDGDEVACADCGTYRDLIGPVSHDGEIIEGGDMVCPDCAETRGLDLSHCTCGTSSPKGMTCPECGDYLGYRSASKDSANKGVR